MTLGIRPCVCGCMRRAATACRISLGSKGNALYRVLCSSHTVICCSVTETACLERLIRSKLKDIMMTVDLEEVTSKYVSPSCACLWLMSD